MKIIQCGSLNTLFKNLNDSLQNYWWIFNKKYFLNKERLWPLMENSRDVYLWFTIILLNVRSKLTKLDGIFFK